MKKLLPLLLLVSTLAFGAYQIIPESVSIGTLKPDASASLQLTGTTKGFIPNKLTDTQRSALVSPATGLIIYNTTVDQLQIYNGSGWISAGSSGGSGIDSWVTGQVYDVDDVVIFNQEIYLCLIAHTSGSFATDLFNGNWLIVSDGISSTGTPVNNSVPTYVGTSGNVIEPSDVIVDSSNNVSGAASLAVGGSLDASSIFDLTSTTKGSKPCPSMTEAQRDLISTPANGLCVYNTDTSKLNVYNGTIWKAAGGGVDNWLTGTAYSIDDLVIESNKLYQAETAHTSGTFATDLTNGEWVQLANDVATSVGVLPVANGGTNSSTALTNGKTVYSNAGALVESSVTQKDLIRSLSKGVISGGVVTINADPTKFDVTAGSGLIVDNWTDTANPVVYSVSWSAQTAVAATQLALGTHSFIGIDNTGAIVQYGTSADNATRRDVILLAKLAHSNLTSIQNTVSLYDAIQSPVEQLRDFLSEIKFVSSGNAISANGVNLNINKSAGTLFGKGVNYASSIKNPNVVSLIAQTPITFQYRTQTGVATANTTAIIPGSYDNAGTVTAMPGGGGTATNQRVYLFPSGNVRIQYGQTIYTSLSNAVQGVTSESFTVFSNIQESAVLVGIISLRKDTTNLSNSAQAIFTPVSKFGEFGGGVSGAATANLQQAYNNSVTPQITTSTALGSLDIIRGSAADTDNVLRIQNGAASDVIKASGTGRLDTRFSSPNNLLNNGDVEFTDISMFTCGSGNTCTRTTTPGEYSQGNAALEIDLSAAALNVSQTVTTPSGIQKQGYFRVIYNIPAALVDAVITITVDGTLQTTLATDKLLKNGLFQSIEVPLTFGSTNVMVKAQTTATYTTGANDVFLDGMIVAQGLGLQNLQTDNVYSAKISVTPTVSSSNVDWITSVTSGGTGLVTIDYTKLKLTQVPSITFGATATNMAVPYVQSISTTSVNIRIGDDTNTAVARAFDVILQKQGNDYLASSANVYSQASANYDWTNYTATFTGLGTVAPSTNNCKHARDGGDLLVNCRLTSFTPAASLVSISLPNGLTLDSTKIIAANTTAAAGQVFGTWTQDALGGYGSIVTATGTSTSVVYTGQYISAANQLIPQNGTSSFTNSITSFRFRVPISGWSSSNYIVGSFENVPTVPGAGVRIDTFSVSYGTTNATTVCSASPCSYLDQIGNSVTSVTRSAAGSYTVNLGKTYTKLKGIVNSASVGAGSVRVPEIVQCSSCSSVSFKTLGNTGADGDSSGTIFFQGTY